MLYKPTGSIILIANAAQLLNQEIIRPMKNTSQRVCGTVRSKILTDFMRMLQKSEHPEKFRRNCLVAALKGYSRMVKN